LGTISKRNVPNIGESEKNMGLGLVSMQPEGTANGFGGVPLIEIYYNNNNL